MTKPRKTPTPSHVLLTRDEVAKRYGDMAAMMMFRAPGGPWNLCPLSGPGREIVRTVIDLGGELVAIVEGR